MEARLQTRLARPREILRTDGGEVEEGEVIAMLRLSSPWLFSHAVFWEPLVFGYEVAA